MINVRTSSLILATSCFLYSAQIASAQELALNELPEKVQATIKQKTVSGEIMGIEEEKYDGKIVYDIEIERDGLEIDLVVALDGTVLEISSDEADKGYSSEITFADLPASVQDRASLIVGKKQIVEIEREVMSSGITYEIDYTDAGFDHAVELSGSGDLLSEEREIESTDLSSDVLARLKRDYPNGTITEAESIKIYLYEVSIEENGETVEVVFLANGEDMKNTHVMSEAD